MSHLKPTRQLNATQKDQMKEWASDNGRAICQRGGARRPQSLRPGHFLSMCTFPHFDFNSCEPCMTPLFLTLLTYLSPSSGEVMRVNASDVNLERFTYSKTYRPGKNY